MGFIVCKIVYPLYARSEGPGEAERFRALCDAEEIEAAIVWKRCNALEGLAAAPSKRTPLKMKIPRSGQARVRLVAPLAASLIVRAVADDSCAKKNKKIILTVSISHLRFNEFDRLFKEVF